MFLLTCAMTFRLFVFASVCFPRRNVKWRCTTHSSIADRRKGVMLQRANVFLTLHCHAFFPQINTLFQELKVQMLSLAFCLCIFCWQKLAFPSDEITVLAPEAVKQWKLVAKTQSVSWQFIMWMEVYLCLPVLVVPLHSDWFAQILLASFQTPTAVLEITVQFFSCSLFVCLLFFLFAAISEDLYVDLGVLLTSGVNKHVTSLPNVFWHPSRDRALSKWKAWRKRKREASGLAPAGRWWCGAAGRKGEASEGTFLFFAFEFLHICACRLIRRSAEVLGKASASMQQSIRTWVHHADLWLKAHAGSIGWTQNALSIAPYA